MDKRGVFKFFILANKKLLNIKEKASLRILLLTLTISSAEMQLPYSIKLTMFQFSSTIDHHVARLSILHQLKGSYSSYSHESNGEYMIKQH